MESNRDRNWDVLNHVLARGPSACDKFREALVAEGEPQSLIELLPLFEDQYQNTLDEVESDASTQSGEEVSQLKIVIRHFLSALTNHL